jgi:hypothetical protein
MSSHTHIIQDKMMTVTKTVKSFRVADAKVALFSSITLFIHFLDATNTIIDRKTLTLSGTEYTNWKSATNGDTYIIDKIKETYGLTSLSQ